MKKLLMLIGMLLGILTILTGCYDLNFYEKYDVKIAAAKQEQEKLEQEEFNRVLQEQEEREKSMEEDEKRKQWELENTDKIYYGISKYSPDGVFVVDDEFSLTPQSNYHLEKYQLENRGWNEELDKNIIRVPSSFLGRYPEGPFDLYYVLWEKGSRTKAVDTGVAYISLSKW